MHKFSFFLTITRKFSALRNEIVLNIRKSDIYFNSFLELFYPESCVFCQRPLLVSGTVLCHVCLSDLPFCRFSEFESNRAEVLFHGRADIQAVASLLYFRKKSVTQHLMHDLKYRGREDIGRLLGRMLADEMRSSGRFDTLDLVLPVPLHPAKKRKRGYNQVAEFGRCLSNTLDLPYCEDVLKRGRNGRSQTSKGRADRIRSLENVFYVGSSNELENKHILIVDDIITSGSTLETCSRLVLDVPGTRVSLASMAYTL